MREMIMAGAQLLAQEKSFVLATVVTSDGSAPRGAGAWMIVQSNGDILGTIGGGILEARVRDLARWVKKTQRTVLQEYCLDGTQSVFKKGVAWRGGASKRGGRQGPAEPKDLGNSLAAIRRIESWQGSRTQAI